MPGRESSGQRLSAQGPLWVEPSLRTMPFHYSQFPKQVIAFPQRNWKKTPKDSRSSRECLKLPKNLCTCKSSAPVKICTTVCMGTGLPSCPIAKCCAQPNLCTCPCAASCLPSLTPVRPHLLLILSHRHTGTACVQLQEHLPSGPGNLLHRCVSTHTRTCTDTPPQASLFLCCEMKGGSLTLTCSYFTKMLF